MSHIISIEGSDMEFSCGDDEFVLDAIENGNYAIPYSCRKGVCSSCEGKLVRGRLQVRGQGLQEGPVSGVRFCQARPLGDVEISPQWIRKDDLPARKKLTARIAKIDYPAEDVAVLTLRLPIGQRAVFKAGQYLRVFLPGGAGDSRNYSMANPPRKNDQVELHVRRVPGGAFSDAILRDLSKGDTLDIEVPFGQFGIEEGDGDTILLASGTGFAPIKSIVEDLIDHGNDRPVRLYWGANKIADLYHLALAQKWAEKFGWFSFVPVVLEPEGEWSGKTGFVHRAVLEDFPDMSRCRVYACGAPAMVNAAATDFANVANLPASSFHCDIFEPSSDHAAEHTQ
ncbi:FAD-binding oxidoreductase [Martelella sp. AMO21009]